MDLLTLAAENPLDHLLQLDRIFEFVELPGVLWRDWFHKDGFGLGISKPILYMWAAIGLACAVFIPMARNFKLVPRGVQSLFEPLLIFVRDGIVRPNIHAPHVHGHGDDHHHHISPEEQAKKDHAFADRFLPFFWTLFFFILFCNLIGLTPHASTPTGQISVTAALAVVSAIMVVGNGIRANGALNYWVNLVPPSVPLLMFGFIPNPIWAVVFGVEFAGLFFKPFALCIRLLANMTGGHIVIATLLGFAVAMNLFHPFYGAEPGVPGGVALGLPVALISVVASALFTAFEIIIGFVQAYVFTLLTATFMGMAVNQDH